mmetsp:Transcript_95994/g.240613  ORF Transcript_95994/g.240613 Transcript_95994/m.240613 type:complete len:229 (+) Transcript_95994:921-1607(+)
MTSINRWNSPSFFRSCRVWPFVLNMTDGREDRADCGTWYPGWMYGKMIRLNSSRSTSPAPLRSRCWKNLSARSSETLKLRQSRRSSAWSKRLNLSVSTKRRSWTWRNFKAAFCPTRSHKRWKSAERGACAASASPSVAAEGRREEALVGREDGRRGACASDADTGRAVLRVMLLMPQVLLLLLPPPPIDNGPVWSEDAAAPMLAAPSALAAITRRPLLSVAGLHGGGV